MAASAVQQDGKSASLTAPNGKAQSSLILSAMAEAAPAAGSRGGAEARSASGGLAVLLRGDVRNGAREIGEIARGPLPDPNCSHAHRDMSARRMARLTNRAHTTLGLLATVKATWDVKAG